MRLPETASKSRLIRMLGLSLLLAALLIQGGALAQGVVLSAAASPDAYYEAFDSDISINVRNASDEELTVTGLLIEDIRLPDTERALPAGDSAQFTARIRITEGMLRAGHFFVTAYYTYTDANGRTVPSIDQIMVPVRKLEDKIEARVRFALPDRPIEGEENVSVSYILENYGETDLAQAVIICYPEGFLSEPSYVPAGGYLVVKRSVSIGDLDKISAKVTGKSAYSGSEYALEAAYEGNLLELAVTAEEYYLRPAETPALTEESVETQVLQQEDWEPQLSANIGPNGAVIIRVSAGSETLTDVRICADQEPIRTLAVLKAGLSAELPYLPPTGFEGEVVFSLIARTQDGTTVELTGEPFILTSGDAAKKNEEEDVSEDFLTKLIEAPRLTSYIVYGCVFALALIAFVLLIKYGKRKALTDDEEEDEDPDQSEAERLKQDGGKEKS